ncbi:DNA polymerase zeta catalytic subunit [Babesia gibsoni]|uniref:DNA polymerase n=1 Tax=Babesia gibsoni TaxID=33632 RepID=A0AAD8UUS2_BABGI|nr:DNA polymerase zeta catalytic subunit [Babesia gibsoni]
MAKPTEFDPHESSTGMTVREVPVIRVFGSTMSGQQACLHVHGYLPYFYLPVPDNVDPTAFSNKIQKTLEGVARRYFHEKLLLRVCKTATGRRLHRRSQSGTPVNQDSNLNLSKGSSASYDSRRGRSQTSTMKFLMMPRIKGPSTHHLYLVRRQASKLRAHIHKVDIVEHVPFYGYHTKPKKYFKVYHYNPALTKHLAGYSFHTGIGKHKLQPHEVHISYLMHFASDYNIKGKDYIYLSSAIKMRGPVSLHTRSSLQPHSLWQRVIETSKKTPIQEDHICIKPIIRNSPSLFLSEHKKSSTCELEIDAHIATILNVVELNKGLSEAVVEMGKTEFSVGGYMGADNCFFEHWDQQCARLNEESISTCISNNDNLMKFASNDTLKMFYKYMMKEAKKLKGMHAASVQNTLHTLLTQCEGNGVNGYIKHDDVAGLVETITMDSTFLQSLENETHDKTDGRIHSYRYNFDPPRIECYDHVTDWSAESQENLAPRKDKHNDEAAINASNNSFNFPQTSIEGSVKAKDRDIFHQLVKGIDNFESGIVLDVITDIELNQIYPDPQLNSINAVVYTLRDHRLKPNFQRIGVPYADVQGAIIVNPNGKPANTAKKVVVEEYRKYGLVQKRYVNMDDIERAIYSGKYTELCYVSSEVHLLETLRNLILDFDPNIIYGYDIARCSIGYINQRAACIGMMGFIDSISRIIPRWKNRWHNTPTNETDASTKMTHQKSKVKKTHIKGSEIQPLVCVGRLLFDLMDVALRELNMAELSLENIVYNQFGYVMPSIHMFTLNKWLMAKTVSNKSDNGVDGEHSVGDTSSDVLDEPDGCTVVFPHQFRCIRYALLRNYAVVATLDKLMYFQKYITFSRLYGIDLKSTIVRGSQYHVESILVRFTKSSNFILPSPTERQVHEQRPSTSIPIVMQPISGFHLAPVAILDFQSLYSCITIAYNICYSTCLGLLTEHMKNKRRFKLGVMKYCPEKRVFEDVLTQSCNFSPSDGNMLGVHIMPNCVMFVDKHIRKGILPTMLRSVLDSRRKTKAAMAKQNVDDMTMQQWHHEQHGLKMISNLSVGLTASGFSGRMPCSDLAESVVSVARALILYCTEIVHNNFDAKVIYGDTDSIFIKFEGRTVSEAEALSKQIAETINASVPEPIKIMPQKVYSPCLLVSKKRYVGLAHSNGKITFDDKGIETMRSSECAATRNILKDAMYSIFKNESLDNAYDELLRLFKNAGGVCTPRDFILYRQIRLGTYKEDRTGRVSTLPAAAIVAKYKIKKHYGKRILENEYIPHVFSLRQSDEQGGIKESAVFPNEIKGIFKATDYIREFGHRTLPQNSVVNIVEQIGRARPLYDVNIDYYLKKQILPPLKRMLHMLDINPSISISQEFLKGLESLQTTVVDKVDKIEKHNKQIEDIWLYTGKHTRCTGCNNLCTIKLGSSLTEYDLEEEDYQEFADAIHHRNVKVSALQKNVLSFESPLFKPFRMIICNDCMEKPNQTLLSVINEVNGLEMSMQAIYNICLNCTGNAVAMASCQNAWHCEVYFKRIACKNSFSSAIRRYKSLLTLAYTS